MIGYEININFTKKKRRKGRKEKGREASSVGVLRKENSPMEILGWPRTMNLGTEKLHCKETPSGTQEETPEGEVLTIDPETVPVQCVGAQPSDPMGLLAELLVQLLSVQPEAGGIRAIGTDRIHSGARSILFSPGEGGAREQRHWRVDYS